MWLPLVLTLAATAPPSTIQMMQRRDVALVVLTPFGSSATTRSSDLIEGAARAFEGMTDLRVIPATQAGVDENRLRSCPAARRVDCWLDTASDARIVMLLVITVVPTKGGDQANIWAFQLPSRRRMKVGGVDLAEPDAAFGRLVDHELRSFLTMMEAFEPHGFIDLETDCTACSVTVGERAPVALGVGRTRLLGLALGDTEVEVQQGATIVCRHIVQIDGTRPASLNCPKPERTSGTGRIATVGGAGLVTAIGVGLVVWSAVLAGQTERVCVSRADASCDFGSSARPTSSEAIVTRFDGGGPPIGPIGLGLIAGGATAGATTMYLEPEQWWVGALTGIGVGLAASLVFVAVD